MKLDDMYCADYSRLMTLLRHKRITLGSFVRKAGLSAADAYLIQVGEMMSVEGEMLACKFLECDIADIRCIIERDTSKPANRHILEQGVPFPLDID